MQSISWFDVLNQYCSRIFGSGIFKNKPTYQNFQKRTQAIYLKLSFQTCDY